MKSFRVLIVIMAVLAGLLLVSCGDSGDKSPGGAGDKNSSKDDSKKGDDNDKNKDGNDSDVVTKEDNSSVYIMGVSSYVDNVRLKDTLVVGDKSTISTLGMEDTDIKVQVSTKRGMQLVSPLSISEANQTVVFVVPPNTLEGNLSIIKGTKRLSSIGYGIYRDFMPFISDITPKRAKPGETVTIRGRNLHSPLMAVSQDGNIDLNVSLTGDTIAFALPDDATSGYVHLKMDQADSNELYLGVYRDIDVEVSLVSGVEVNASKIAFTIEAVEYNLESNFKTTIPARNTLEQIFAILEHGDGEFSTLYSAVVLPDMNGTIMMDEYSTAVSLIFIGLGIDDRHIASDRWRKLYDDVKGDSKVDELAKYIAKLQKDNYSAWADRNDITLKEKFQTALKSVLKNQGALKMSKMASAGGDTNNRSLVVIKQDPESGKIYIDDKVSGKKLNNGSVAIVNDTNLYLSVEAKSKKSGSTIGGYKHIYSYFTDQYEKGLVEPNSGGLWGFANKQTLNLNGESANIEIVTAGYINRTDKEKVSNFLRTRTLIDNFAVPSVNAFLSILAEREIPKNKKQSSNLIKGMSTIWAATSSMYKGTGFIAQLSTQVSNSKGDWYPIIDTFFMMPLKSGISSCFKLGGITGSICTQTLIGVSQMLGLDPNNAVEVMAYVLASSIQKRALKRGVAIVPYVGWATAAAFFVYDNYKYVSIASNISTMGSTLVDLTTKPAEINVDVDFKLKISEVKPLCLAISPQITETPLYVHGERFLLEDGSRPTLSIGGLDAKNLDTVTETRVYGKFDAQKLIEDGSQQQLVFLRYGELFVEHDKLIRVVDQRDSGIYFDQIVPHRAAKGATVELHGCGWIPLDDVKVLFSKENSNDEYVEATIITKKPDLLTAKVPSDAKSGWIYVTDGTKKTKELYFEVDPFSLNEPYDEEVKLAKKAPFSWSGHMLDKAVKIYFTDHKNVKREGAINQQDENSIKVTVPDGLAYGPVCIYAEDSDGIETNEITLPYVPLGVDANPSSKSFEDSITVTLTQEDNVDIYYRIDDGEEQKYTAPITLKEEEAVYVHYSLYVWARVEVGGVKYESNELEYKYMPKMPLFTCNEKPSYCKISNGTSLIKNLDIDGDRSYDDVVQCSYTTTQSRWLITEMPFLHGKFSDGGVKHGSHKRFTHGKVDTISQYSHGKKDGYSISCNFDREIDSCTEWKDGKLIGDCAQ